ncbi:MAG: branched-chain amino acid ABC transporter permease [Clostridiales Family XIII bacterium]|jgi:branched-chain amino acid transport system permease protein|nr:branched-chain amino acid ABC transporter permease [Clostridiales Family XIII bacterium]
MTATIKPQKAIQAVLKNAHVQFLVFGGLLLLLPVIAESGIMKMSTLETLGFVLIYSIVSIGMNLLLGYSGLVSLGTAGFMGLGAYLAAYTVENLSLSFWVAVFAAMVIPTAIGLAVGAISLRLRNIYLAIATLCISEILMKTFEQLDWFTGGTAGKQSQYPTIFGDKLDRGGVFVVIVVVLVLIMMLTHNIVNGQMGRALHAMRSSEVAAQAMGVNLVKYKLVAFALATAYAGLGGGLYLFFLKSSYPSTWSLMLSLNVIAMVVVGGLRSIFGTVAGAVIIWGVPELVLKKLPVIGSISGLPYIFSGILIIVVIMFFPRGLKGLFDIIVDRIRRLSKKKVSAVPGKSADTTEPTEPEVQP